MLSQFWTVTTPLDGVDLPGSLRYEISQAQAGDTIKFAGKLQDQTITLNSSLGALSVTKDLEIQGIGNGRVTISGGDSCRVFEIGPGASVTLARLTIAHGKAAGGGGISNDGNLTLSHCVITANQSSGEMGSGGILNQAEAMLTLSQTDVLSNVATAGAGQDVFGGGLLNEGVASVTCSTFVGNQALQGGSGTLRRQRGGSHRQLRRCDAHRLQQ